jgi:multiple sugar transport system substrate-binding protein
MYRMDAPAKLSRRTLIYRALVATAAALPLAACGSGVQATATTVATGTPATTTAAASGPTTAATTTAIASSAGSTTPSVSAAKQAGAAPVHIVVSQWTDQSPAIKAFGEQFPQVKVDYSSLDYAKHYERVKSAAAAGTPEDSFWLDNTQVSAYVGGGFVRAIDDFVGRDPAVSQGVFPSALQYFKRQGKLYGIAQNLSVFILYYDQDRFAAAGVPAPTPDWTLSAWSDAAQRLANPGAKQAGVVLGTDTRGYWMFLKAFGGGWTDPGGTRSRLADPETLTGIQFIKDLLDQQRAVRPSATAPYGLFQDGSAGMMAQLNSEAAWALRKAQTPFKWDLAEPPVGTKGRGTAEAGTGWVVSEGGKQLDAAWQFANWMTDAPAQTLLTAANALVPSMRSVAADPKVNPAPPANLKGVADAHGYADFDAVPSNVINDPTKAKAFNDAVSQALTLIFSGKASVHDALSQADSLVAQQKVFAGA